MRFSLTSGGTKRAGQVRRPSTRCPSAPGSARTASTDRTLAGPRVRCSRPAVRDPRILEGHHADEHLVETNGRMWVRVVTGEGTPRRRADSGAGLVLRPGRLGSEHWPRDTRAVPADAHTVCLRHSSTRMTGSMQLGLCIADDQPTASGCALRGCRSWRDEGLCQTLLMAPVLLGGFHPGFVTGLIARPVKEPPLQISTERSRTFVPRDLHSGSTSTAILLPPK